jgi:hypothetical protein
MKRLLMDVPFAVSLIQGGRVIMILAAVFIVFAGDADQIDIYWSRIAAGVFVGGMLMSLAAGIFDIVAQDRSA